MRIVRVERFVVAHGQFAVGEAGADFAQPMSGLENSEIISTISAYSPPSAPKMFEENSPHRRIDLRTGLVCANADGRNPRPAEGTACLN